MPPESGEFALVTGASSGIGLELARCFARDGYGLFLTAHVAAELEEAAALLREAGSPRVETIVADLSKPGSALQLAEDVQARWGHPHFLVNNAGAGVHGDFVGGTDLDRELGIIQLNVVSVVELTKRIAPRMVERGSGRILITSSIAGLAPTPKLTVYAATKAFDFAFAEALANELKDTGVTVTALLPSETETKFFERADMEDTQLAQSNNADPADVARAGYTAMMKGTDHVFAPFKAKMMAGLTAVLPQSLVTWMARAE